MEERPRLKRPDPERVDPIRNWSQILLGPQRASGASPDSESSGEPRRDATWGDAVSDGVKLAYRVAEEQIRLGQRVAQQINERTYGLGSMGSDMREVTDRMMRGWMDLSALWLEMLGTLVGSVRPAAAGSAESTGHGRARVSLDIASSQPAQVTLEIEPEAEREQLTVYELRCPETRNPPLTDVGLETAKYGRGLQLRLRVPATQPPGLYSGVVVDGTGNVRGTLSVRIGEAPRAPSPAEP